MFRILHFWLVFCLLLPCFCLAQSKKQALTFSPAFQNFSTDEGLPNNWIYDIIQDSKGYIWVATNYGICRYDGYEFKQFRDTLYANQTSVLTNSMMEDEAGRMWFVNFHGKVFYIENERIIPYRHQAVLDSLRTAFNFAHGLIVEKKGKDLWIGLNIHGIIHVDSEGQVSALDKGDKTLEPVLYRNGRTIRIQFPDIVFPKQPESLWPIRFYWDLEVFESDTIWYSQKTKVGKSPFIFHVENNKYFLYYARQLLYMERDKLLWDLLCTHDIIWLYKSRAGGFWQGTLNNGLRYFPDLDHLKNIKPAHHFLHGHSVSVVLEDWAGGLWVGTQQQGVFYLPLKHGSVSGFLFGKEIQSPTTLDFDGKNQLLIGTSDGLLFNIEKKEAFRVLPLTQTSLSGNFTHIHCIDFRPSHRVFSVAGTGTALFDPTQPGILQNKNHLYPSHYAHHIKSAGTGLRIFIPDRTEKELWYSANMVGILCFDWKKGMLRYDSKLETHQKHRINCMVQDSSNRIWLGTSNGLLEYEPHQFKAPTDEHPALKQSVSDLLLREDNTLVVAAKGHGISFFKENEKVVEYSEKQGLLPSKVTRLRFGRQISHGRKTIYGCTEQGLNVLIPNAQDGYGVQTFTIKNGLPSNSIKDVCEAWGELWMCTGKGLFKMPIPDVRGESLRSESVRGRPLITALKINNSTIFQRQNLTFPYDSSNVSIAFSALDFAANQQTVYRYRLLGSQTDTSWTVGKEHIVNYTNLSPDRYRFEVQAEQGKNTWSESAFLAFSIRPPWYATWWFRSFLGICALGLGYFFYKNRTDRLKREANFQTEIYNLERAALQAQMNPHFIFNCLNSIQKFILNNEKMAAASFLSKFAKLVRGTLESSAAGEVSLYEEIQMLEHYLALEKLRFKDAFGYAVKAEEGLDQFDLVFPPMLVQPFVENAILHGVKNREQGGRIEVSFFEKEKRLFVEIKDNGTGNNPSEPRIQEADERAPFKTSLGGKLTRRRLELLNRQKDTYYVEQNISAEGCTVLVCLGHIAS